MTSCVLGKAPRNLLLELPNAKSVDLCRSMQAHPNVRCVHLTLPAAQRLHLQQGFCKLCNSPSSISSRALNGAAKDSDHL